MLGVNPKYVDKLNDIDNTVVVNIDTGTVTFKGSKATALPTVEHTSLVRR
jgi:hypothetical protein